jgi:hypothetical protein
MAKVQSPDDATRTPVAKAGGEPSGKPSGKKSGTKSGKKSGARTEAGKAGGTKVKRSELERQLAKAGKQVDKLRATVEELEAKLEKSRAKAQQWKTEARQERTKVAKLEAKLRRARRDAPVDHEPPAERGDLPVEDPTVPDATWTVARLRVVAREKNVAGASRMTKAALLDALRG